MAFNKNNGDSSFQKNPQPSALIDTFFSTDAMDGNYQFVQINTYGDKVALNFCKGRKGDQNRVRAFMTFNYETITALLTHVIEPLIASRAIKFQRGEEYPSGVWFNYTFTFVDNATKQSRTSGSFVIKSEISPITNRNCVYICYTNGTDNWDIALGSSDLTNRVKLENPSTDGLDVSDSRFQQFGYVLRSIVNNWVSIQMMNHQTSLMMYNFNAIKTKLGIENKQRFSGKDNGNYTDSNYRSSAPDADADDSGFSNDLPF